MKFIVDGNIYFLEKDEEIIEKIADILTDEMEKTNKVIKSLEIDGLELYQDYFEYILDNINYIESINAKLITYKELVGETLVGTIDYLQGAAEEIVPLSEAFYAEPTKESWDDFSDLLEGINWIISVFNLIDNDKTLIETLPSYEIWNLYAKDILTLNELIPQMNDALNSKDNTLLADLMMYEILPLYEDMREQLLSLYNSKEN
ncbi:hypothetical protein E4100_02840 [Soehngenia longivitae]|uniref:Uncharacterized protein n=1 Tax=Soehngenia longivitae TaxID=2562294 RepID=A0A4Z0D815_9FIRM|nr:hypothetical protein [Soehngenia longivitae]TFZ41049.1 hypothetical protein E4100_02840 [Soehngenia longivitae]